MNGINILKVPSSQDKKYSLTELISCPKFICKLSGDFMHFPFGNTIHRLTQINIAIVTRMKQENSSITLTLACMNL